MRLEEKISAARGEGKVDLLLKNGKIINVFSGEIYPGNVAIHQDLIVGVGDYSAKETIDLEGAYVAPGFFDSHVHIESSMLTIPEYARAVVPRGTTSVVIDPHEIANVLGLNGVSYMLESAKHGLINVYLMISSCVPATKMESSGAELSSLDIEHYIDKEWVIGLGEMMNFPGVLNRDPEIMAKLRAAHGDRIDGHAPGLTGKELAAYVAAGINSDHECVSIDEAREKLRQGMFIMVREGSTAKNLEALFPLINEENQSRFMFCTDDRHPYDLVREGHIDHIIRQAVRMGMPPAQAVRLATLNSAEYFRLKNIGAIAPGYRADLAIFDDFEHMNMKLVLKDGRIEVKDGELILPETKKAKIKLRSSINVNWLEKDDFKIEGNPGRKIRVIETVPKQIITRQLVVEPKVENGELKADLERDILKIAVIERHMASGDAGLGFVKGFGLKKGALASTVAHDSHNLIVVGTNDDDMLAASIELVKSRGGLVAVVDGKVIANLPLPIAGLISEETLKVVRDKIENLKKASKSMGCVLKDPFMQLAFLALPVIPELKITDKGLVDVAKFELTSLYLD